MRYRFSLTLFVIFMPFCRLDAQALVGLLGRSDSLQIRGNHYFSEPSIIGALMRSPDFLIAAHPKASRAAFLETTARLIQAGYLVQGHPEAKVVATLSEDEQKVQIEVHEGPFYACGAIEVKGAKEMPVPALKAFLTEVSGTESGGEQPVWDIEKPAPFGEQARVRVEKRVLEQMKFMGFFSAEVSVRIHPDRDAGDARLEISILEEGPLCSLGEIRVEGNQRHTNEAIIGFAGLSGKPLFTSALIQGAEASLRASRCFLSQQVLLDGDPKDGVVDLVIRVREYEKSPASGQTWSKKDEMLLRAAEWISEAATLGKDLEVLLKAEGLDFQFRGILSEKGVSWLLEESEPSQQNEAYFGCTLTHQHLTWMSFHDRQLWRRDGRSGLELKAFVSLQGVPDPASDKEVEFFLGAGVHSNASSLEEGNEKVNVSLHIEMDPVALHQALKPDDLVWSQVGGKHHFKSDVLELILEKDPWRVASLTLDLPAAKGLNKPQVQLRWSTGAFEKLGKELAVTTRDFKNVFQSESPVSTWVELIAGQIAQSSYLPAELLGSMERRQFIAFALSNLSRAKLLSPLDSFISGIDREPARPFFVPMASSEPAEVMRTLAIIFAAYAFEIADGSFPEDSWPWTAMRETVYVLIGKGDHAGQELQRLMDQDQMGPLGYWALSQLLSMAGHPATSFVARNGQLYLDQNNYLKDLKLLISAHPALGEGLQKWMNAYRELSPESHQLAEELLGESLSSAINQWSQSDPDDDLMTQLGILLWQSGLKEALEQQFKDWSRPRPSI